MARLLRAFPLALTALLFAGVALPRIASADETPAHLTVRGQGLVSVRPDVAVITMGANVRRETADDAFNQANTLIAMLNAALRAQGIAERDVQTRQFSLSPEYGRQNGDAPAPLIGWRAINTVSIKLRDFSTIGAVVDTGARILGNDGQISSISFTVEDTDAIARQARAAAITNARERADQIAAAAGVRLVRVLSINETSAPPPSPVALAAPAGVALAAAAPRAAEVSPGDQTLSVTVEIIYEIG